MHPHHRTSALPLLASLALATSCIDLVGPDRLPGTARSAGTPPGGAPASPSDSAQAPSDSTPAPPVTTAVIRIVTSTTGTALDPNGYTVSVIGPPGTPPAPIADSGSVEIRLPVGTYVIGLSGVSGNCAVEAVPWWGTLREVKLREGADAEATFAVSCDSIPTARLAPGDQLAFVRDGQIWLVNSDGNGAVQLTNGPGDARPAWSPDGRRIAFARQESQDEWGGWRTAIYLMDADGSNLIRLGIGDSYDREPTWSPDGQRIAYASRCAGGQACLLVASVDPTDTSRTRIGSLSGGSVYSPAWSPDGARIAFTSDWAFFDDASDVYLADTAGSATTPLTSGISNGTPQAMYYAPAWSPDGALLSAAHCTNGYYICDVGALVVMNADGSGERVLVATRGGATPSWSPDGRTIAFTNAGSIQWITADGSARGLIVENGGAPAWRPR